MCHIPNEGIRESERAGSVPEPWECAVCCLLLFLVLYFCKVVFFTWRVAANFTTGRRPGGLKEAVKALPSLCLHVISLHGWAASRWYMLCS